MNDTAWTRIVFALGLGLAALPLMGPSCSADEGYDQGAPEATAPPPAAESTDAGSARVATTAPDRETTHSGLDAARQEVAEAYASGSHADWDAAIRNFMDDVEDRLDAIGERIGPKGDAAVRKDYEHLGTLLDQVEDEVEKMAASGEDWRSIHQRLIMLVDDLTEGVSQLEDTLASGELPMKGHQAPVKPSDARPIENPEAPRER